MKDVDKLLERARIILNALDIGLFPPDDDEFIEALGVDKLKYEVKHQDGTVGYDFLAALNDTVKEVWAKDLTVCRGESDSNTARTKETEEMPKFKNSKKTKNLFGWG